MLQTNKYTGKIVTLISANGVEIIGTVKEETLNTIVISRPLAVNSKPDEKGVNQITFVPWVATADTVISDFEFQRPSILCIAIAMDEAAQSYITVLKDFDDATALAESK